MTADNDLLHSLGFLTGRVHNLIKKRVQHYLDQTGVPLKMDNYPAMRLLLRQQGLSQQAIADQIGFDRHRTSRMLDELERVGLINRMEHPDNRREKLVCLTHLGEQSLGVIKQAVSQATQDALAELSAEQSATVVAALQTMSQSLTN